MIQIGILSAAKIARRSVIPALLALPEIFRVSGIAARSKEQAAEVAASFGIPVFDNYEALISDNETQAVYIPLPTGLHYEWALKALNAGKHVLVEKSLACSVHEVDGLIEVARTKGLALVENFQFLQHSQFSFIKEQLQQGTIGELRCLRSSFGFPPFADADNIRYDAALGGGALLDAGAYTVKVSSELIDGALRVKASALNVDPSRNVDITGGAFLQQARGSVFSETAFGFDHAYRCDVDCWGSKGRITADRIFTAPPDHRAEVIVQTNSGTEKHYFGPENHFEKMLRYFYEVIQSSTLRSKEYEKNRQQAVLLSEIKLMADV